MFFPHCVPHCDLTRVFRIIRYVLICVRFQRTNLNVVFVRVKYHARLPRNCMTEWIPSIATWGIVLRSMNRRCPWTVYICMTFKFWSFAWSIPIPVFHGRLFFTRRRMDHFLLDLEISFLGFSHVNFDLAQLWMCSGSIVDNSFCVYSWTCKSNSFLRLDFACYVNICFPWWACTNIWIRARLKPFIAELRTVGIKACR